MDLLGWTQEEIAAKLQELWPDARGVDRSQVSRSLCKNGNDDFCTKVADDLSRGLDPATASKRYELPLIVVWAIKLHTLTDQERFKELGITHLPYDVWNFSGCHTLFGASHPGRIPGELVAHTLLALTQPGDLVIDPMVGSGTTIDVCLAMGRRKTRQPVTSAAPLR